jgi:hypothetical protein
MNGVARAGVMAGACLLVSMGSAAARASESIEYQAAAGCPDRGAFLEAAARKAPQAKDGLAAAGPFRIEVKATLAGYSGVLERRAARDAVAPAPRVLFAARCADVVEALALTLALSLVPEPPAAIAAAAPPVVPPAGRGQLTLGTGLQAGRFVDSDSMLGATVAVGYARGERDQRWSLGPEGRLRFSWSRNDVARTAGRARFQLMTAALELCPLHLAGGRARLGLCGLFEAGTLDGEGIGVAHPHRARATWLALGAGPELEVAVTRRWRLVGTAFAARPLQQIRFVFSEPDEPVGRTAGVALSGALALAVHFP